MPPPADHCIALGVWRNGSFTYIDAFDEMEPFDRRLFIVPLSQFRTPPKPAAAEPPATPLAAISLEEV